MTLREQILAIPTPKRYENDANGNWFSTDMEYGWDCGLEAAAALIPEGAVLVDAADLQSLRSIARSAEDCCDSEFHISTDPPCDTCAELDRIDAKLREPS